MGNVYYFKGNENLKSKEEEEAEKMMGQYSKEVNESMEKLAAFVFMLPISDEKKEELNDLIGDCGLAIEVDSFSKGASKALEQMDTVLRYVITMVLSDCNIPPNPEIGEKVNNYYLKAMEIMMEEQGG